MEQLRNGLGSVKGNRAGLVLTYVHAPGDGEGQHLSTEVNLRLGQAYPDVFTADTIYDDFDYKDTNRAMYGTVLLEIFFMSNGCA